MAAKRQYIFLTVAFFVLIITLEATLAQANEKGGDKGKDIGKGDEKDNGKGKGDAKGSADEKSPKPKEDDKGKGKGDANGKVDDKGKPKGDDKGKGKGDENGKVDDKGKPKGDDKGKGKGEDEGKEKASTNYIMLGPVKKTGQEQALCMARGRCFLKIRTCPNQCKVRKPKKARKVKGCFIDCSKCETTCKYRKPNCNGYGSVCYDPRFVGGDGVMFYFHGATGGNFALVSDDHLQINAHFIGNRPQGRNRDFTWIQALSVMFDSHTLVIAAQRIAKWDDAADALILRWDGEDVAVPIEGEAEWRITTDDGKGREVIVERTEETNNIRVTIDGLVEMDLKVTPIGEEENRIHNYQIPAGDAFAHLETQFRFANLSEGVEGVLGQTYQPGYVSPVKTGVAMPMMGGEDKYRTASLFSPVCAGCRFRGSAVAADVSVDSKHGVAEL